MSDATTAPVHSEQELDKFTAEAEQARALARKADAETRKLEAEARGYEASSQVAEISLAKAQREEELRLAGNLNHRVYHFTSAVDSKSVASCMDWLNVWRRGGSPVTMEIIFTSPGGSVVDGMALFDFIQQLRREGHTIVTGTLGMAASMAGILLQAGDTRWVGKEAWVLIHQVQAGVLGSWGEIEDRVKWLEKVQDRILDIFADRASKATGRSAKTVRAMVKKEWSRTDWWLSSDECLANGFVDEVR